MRVMYARVITHIGRLMKDDDHREVMRKIKAPKAARKFYLVERRRQSKRRDGGEVVEDIEEEEKEEVGGLCANPLMAALKALSPGPGTIVCGQTGEKTRAASVIDKTDVREKSRFDEEMHAAMFSIEEAPLSPGYWDQAEGSYFDDTDDLNLDARRLKNIEVVMNTKPTNQQRQRQQHQGGCFGGGIAGFLTSPRLTGMVSNAFTGAKDFCEFRQMLSNDSATVSTLEECKEEEEEEHRRDEEDEEDDDVCQDPGPLLYQSPKCAKKKQSVVNIDATPEKISKKDFKEIAKSRRGLLPFFEEYGAMGGDDDNPAHEEMVLNAFSKREAHNNPLQSPQRAKKVFIDAKKGLSTVATTGKFFKKNQTKTKLTSSEALAAETYCEAILKGIRHEEASAIAAQKVRAQNEKSRMLKQLAQERKTRKKALSLPPPPPVSIHESGTFIPPSAVPTATAVGGEAYFNNSKTNSYQVSPCVSYQEALENNDDNNNNINRKNKKRKSNDDDEDGDNDCEKEKTNGGGLWSPIHGFNAVSQFCSSYFPDLGLQSPDRLEKEYAALSAPPPREKKEIKGAARMIWWTR